MDDFDLEAMPNYAGQGAGLIQDIIPAGARIQRMIEQAVLCLGGESAVILTPLCFTIFEERAPVSIRSIILGFLRVPQNCGQISRRFAGAILGITISCICVAQSTCRHIRHRQAVSWEVHLRKIPLFAGTKHFAAKTNCALNADNRFVSRFRNHHGNCGRRD